VSVGSGDWLSGGDCDGVGVIEIVDVGDGE
jgi:hypothetical protein